MSRVVGFEPDPDREPVRLVFTDNFSVGMRHAAELTGLLRSRLALLDATWEPHDWSDFGPFADGGYIGGGS